MPGSRGTSRRASLDEEETDQEEGGRGGEDVGVIPSRESDQRGYAPRTATKSLFRSEAIVLNLELRGREERRREKSDYPARYNTRRE